jgi:K+-dependent Na+/Ca+ exchanger-like protein
MLSVVCDEYFVKALDVISKRWKLSDDVAGATLMAIGTSAPEFFTSMMALLNWGKAWLGAWTIIGSAIFNILCIAWGSALFLNATLKKWPFLRDSLFYALFIGLIAWSFWDGQIVWIEAIAYLGMYAVYIGYLVYSSKKKTSLDIHDSIEHVASEVQELEQEAERRFPFLQLIDWLVHLTYPQQSKLESYTWYVFWMSIAWIVFLSWVLVESWVLLAHTLGISEVIVGLTVLAAGTSVPDLLSSLIVAKQWRGDMAVANALGSNIFDIGICLGLPWIVYLAITQAPVPVSNGDLTISIATLMGVLVLVVGTFLITKFRINKTVWYVFIWAYVCYVAWAIYSAVS